MTTITEHFEGFSSGRLDRRRSRCGFTLAEVMTSLGIASFILIGILSTFLFISKSCMRLVNYHEMNSQAQRALELFSREARTASDILSFTTTSITLRVPTGTAATYTVTYGYNSFRKTFTRTRDGVTTTLVTGVTNAFTFSRFTLQQTPANNLLETKQLQLSLRAERKSSMIARATDTVLTARIIMRNKRVST